MHVQAGLDDIISLVPVYGDILSGILQLYQVWLSFVFGVPLNILGYMVSLSNPAVMDCPADHCVGAQCSDRRRCGSGTYPW